MELEQRIIHIVRAPESEIWSLATMSEGKPWVRYVRGTIDDALVLRIPTFMGTRKLFHIRANPEVHITLGSKDSTRPGSYLQIQAQAVISQADEDRRLAWSDRLETWFADVNDPQCTVVRATPYRIVICPIGRADPAEVWPAD